MAKLFDDTAGITTVSDALHVPLIAGSTLRVGGDMVLGDRMTAAQFLGCALVFLAAVSTQIFDIIFGKEKENIMRKEENEIAVAMRAGFTLVELLVVVAIIGILGTIAIQNVKKHIDDTNKTAAKATVQSVSEAVTSYYISKKKMPTNLTQLVEGTDDDPPIIDGGEGALNDPWDNELKYEQHGKRFVIISAGPDGEFGNEDDIRSDKK